MDGNFCGKVVLMSEQLDSFRSEQTRFMRTVYMRAVKKSKIEILD